MKPTFYLLYNQFFSYSDNKQRKIGGIETYIERLALLVVKMRYQAVVCQFSEEPYEKEYEGFVVRGYRARNMKDLYRQLSPVLLEPDVVIFMNDSESLRVRRKRVLSIQHGIGWDRPYIGGNHWLNVLKRGRALYRAFTDFQKCTYSVCVDYNFYNWYKIHLVDRIPENTWVIPNFASHVISDKELNEKLVGRKNRKNIRIVFARRFVGFRGATLFANAAVSILAHHPEAYITIAGEGPLESEMRDILSKYMDRVSFTRYLPQNSFDFHKAHDIAVVPTIGSEGTSLSLLEAMGSGCIPVATPVGGMSNIIIDGFNGFFAMPNQKDLEKTLEKAISAMADEKILQNAVQTVELGFSLSKWEERWREVLLMLAENFATNV